jgi:hypothetical protein
VAPGGIDFIQAGAPYDDAGMHMAALKSNISLVKDHPAVLGYYFCVSVINLMHQSCCNILETPHRFLPDPLRVLIIMNGSMQDDCCGSRIARMAPMYALFKELDPYHPTFGAVNCDYGHSFSDGQPGTEPSQVERTMPVLPFNKQPALQLSLDVVMLENYGRSIAGHVNDGERVKGLWQEPTVNCPPNYGFEKAVYSTPTAPLPELPAAQYRTLLWLGVIQGSMVNQLNFDIGCAHPPCTFPGLVDTFYSFGAELQALRPSLYGKFGQTPSPLTVVVSNHSANAGLLGRAYRQSASCLHLIVANTDTSRATSFTASFSAPMPQTATILFTGDYSVKLDARDGLTDFIGPGQTNVYQVGGSCVVPAR